MPVGTSLLKNLMDKLHRLPVRPTISPEIEPEPVAAVDDHCGLTACNPVLDTIAKFRPAYERRHDARTSRRPSTSTAALAGWPADDRARRPAPIFPSTGTRRFAA